MIPETTLETRAAQAKALREMADMCERGDVIGGVGVVVDREGRPHTFTFDNPAVRIYLLGSVSVLHQMLAQAEANRRLGV